MGKKIRYQPLKDNAEKIWSLVEKGRYRSPDTFIDNAVKLLLAWESERPEDSIKIMQSMMPFTPEQETLMQTMMKEEERKRYFGKSEIELAVDEAEKQKTKSYSDYDHIIMRNNFEKAKKFIAKIEISKPEHTIDYDGYPLFFRFYSRFFPVKIVVSVLANMMYEKNQTSVKLSELRSTAYDIAEEIAGNLIQIETENDIPRNKKTSTGLPKKGIDEEDIVKRAQVQKRFKDQFVGRTRKNKEEQKVFVEGAPSALGLVYVFEQNGEEYITLTEKGRKFYTMPNLIIGGHYKENSLTNEESKFILEELIPSLKLEKIFIDIATKTIKQSKTEKTDVLDREFLKAFKKYSSDNKSDAIRFGFDVTLSSKEITKSKITAYRVATMGRLTELHVVNWEIDEKGESVFMPKYGPDSYDVYGYDKEGYNREGYDAYGHSKDGLNNNRINKLTETIN